MNRPYLLKVFLKAASLCQHFCQNVSLKVADKHYEKTRFTMRLPRLPTARVNIITLQGFQAELGYVTAARITLHNNCVHTAYMSKISSRMFFCLICQAICGQK